jgi:transcriptional regulator with XRE-family HTH domain
MKGPELKQIREEMKMSQATFGKLLGYHQAQVRISEFERGVRIIPARVVEACGYMKKKVAEKPVGSEGKGKGI